MPRNRAEYMREYMRKRRAKQPKAPRKPRVSFKITHSNRASAGKKGALAHAGLAASRFHQPSLIDFPQHLMAQFEEIMNQVRWERGAKWAAISWAHV